MIKMCIANLKEVHRCLSHSHFYVLHSIPCASAHVTSASPPFFVCMLATTLSLFQALVRIYRRGHIGLNFIKLHYLDHLLGLERLHGTAALLTIDDAEKSHKFVCFFFFHVPFPSSIHGLFPIPGCCQSCYSWSF